MSTYETSGTVTADGSLVLDTPLPITEGKVRITVRPEADPPKAKPSLSDYLEALRQRQAARGHVPMTGEEVDAYLREECESWD